MRDGDIEFQRIINDSERAVKQMAACGLGHSAKAVKDLLRLVKVLDKNQKSLIKHMLLLQRANKIWKKTGDLMMSYLTIPQKYYVKQFVEELKNDTAQVNSTTD